MSALATAPPLFGRLGDGPRLDEMISSAWDELCAQRAVPCPMCRGEMEPEYGAHAGPVGGRCTSCGASLA